MSKLINCTPHTVTLLDPSSCNFDPKSRCYRIDGEVKILATFEPCGVCPRCSQKEQTVGAVNDTPVVRMTFGEVAGLPAPAEDTYYIVSQMVASAAPEREDLIIPAHMVRNTEGAVLGCLAFARI